jgi:disulfide bond formation protein DsbB
MAHSTCSMMASRPIFAAAVAVAVVGAATILGAWFFQYGLGINPCPLCLEQRHAYYFAVPLAAMVALGEQAGASRKVLIGALIAIAAGMLWNAGLGVYHSGVEWRWWPVFTGRTRCLSRRRKFLSYAFGFRRNIHGYSG